MQTTVDLLEMLHTDTGELSPARFQASVHNTASGTLSIALQNRAFSTSLAAGLETPAMALFEAYAWVHVHGGQLLVAIGDEASPPRLLPDGTYPALGAGVLLEGRRCGAPRPARRLGTLRSFTRESGSTELLASGDWRRNPCSAAVPFAERLASRQLGAVSLRHPTAPSGWAVLVE